ncbi:MAG: hypothetical protein GF329_03990 [Candidatus Lokiarchaeota archaeon]|nr:hypothetical protein [Candidatus Lokiarchaeota archaeon]
MTGKFNKIGIWKKFLGRIGKHFYWWKANKTSGLMFTVTILECIKTLIELNNGDIIEGMRQSSNVGSLVGKEVVSELLGAGEMIFSKRVEDMPYLIKVAWYIFLNDEIEDIEYLPKTAEEPHRVVWKLSDCMFCKYLEYETEYNFDQNTLKTKETRLTYGSPVTKAVESIINEILDYVESEYRCEVYETKCIQNGDPYPEYTAYYYTRE